MDAEETKIWETFCNLNQRGKTKAVDFLMELSELKKYHLEE